MEPCPSREQLELLSSRKLDPTNQVVVATHVQGCTLCQDAVAALNPHQATAEYKPSAQAEEEISDDSKLPEALRQHPRYRVLGVLGRGGMGAVYKAEHRLLERLVVLKVIRPELVSEGNVVQRFQ